MAGPLFWKKKCFEVRFKPVKRFLLERKGKASPSRGTKDRKDAGTSSGKSDTKNQNVYVVAAESVIFF